MIILKELQNSTTALAVKDKLLGEESCIVLHRNTYDIAINPKLPDANGSFPGQIVDEQKIAAQQLDVLNDRFPFNGVVNTTFCESFFPKNRLL